MIADHGIWSDFNHWRNLVSFTMRHKIDEAIRRKKINGTSLQNIKAATSKLMQTKDEKFKQEMKDHQNLVFNELSRFVAFFVNLSLPYE